jgi:hypothetical protein
MPHQVPDQVNGTNGLSLPPLLRPDYFINACIRTPDTAGAA